MKGRETHRAAGVVLFRDLPEREYLLLRSALTRRPVWEFAKGGIESGEDERTAAERELREETGLPRSGYEVLPGFREDEHYFFRRGSSGSSVLVSKHVTYFLARWCEGEIQISREASRYQWATYDEARRLLRFPQKRRILEHAEQHLNG
jgi:8-oxo-dGTP pyrophosphatase MutT (NUDIX family)